jgi:hypothetical protein
VDGNRTELRGHLRATQLVHGLAYVHYIRIPATLGDGNCHCGLGKMALQFSAAWARRQATGLSG